MPFSSRPPARLLAAAALAVSLAVGAGGAAAQADPGPSSPFVQVAGRASEARIYVTPTTAAGGRANTAQVLDRDGRVVWRHTAPAGLTDADLRPQTLHGKPVLTFWEGTDLGAEADGTDYVLDSHHRVIARVHAGDGLRTDGHEFLLDDDGTAWVLAYQRSTADLRSIGGPARQVVLNGVVQHVDVRTGRVLFSWNSADHVPFAQSYQPLPDSPETPWDWFHVNAVHHSFDHQLLVDARNTWTAYKLDARSGRTLWQLGGKASSFRITAADGQQLNRSQRAVAWQHDVDQVGRDRYTFFDNESAGIANTGQDADTELDHSRAVTLRLDERRRTAVLVRSLDQPRGDVAPSQGNAQTRPDGSTFVGWGALPEVSEFDRRGRLVFDARFPVGVNTYRAYLGGR